MVNGYLDYKLNVYQLSYLTMLENLQNTPSHNLLTSPMQTSPMKVPFHDSTYKSNVKGPTSFAKAD